MLIYAGSKVIFGSEDDNKPLYKNRRDNFSTNWEILKLVRTVPDTLYKAPFRVRPLDIFVVNLDLCGSIVVGTLLTNH